MALANSNFKNVSAGELEALFTWSRQLEPIEAGILPIRDLRTAITTRLRTQWDIHFDPSNLEFRYCDLEGDAFQVPNDWTVMQLLGKNTVLTGESGSTTTSNPLCSYQVPHSLSCYVRDAIKLALELSYPDVLHWRTGKCPTCFFLLSSHDTLLTRRTSLEFHLSIYFSPL